MNQIEKATGTQTTITLTQMSGHEVEVVTVIGNGGPGVRVLSDEKAATLASLVAAFLKEHGH